ncbi:VOC family protein [Rhizobium sp. S152]|uniref:VOC family protein n=1 Tax=Rhizobium sp. S152 TaxID=3055038 RepID=UPI0025A97136|nr:VOC family protein [Rhizobium sp. S152]MDM9625267.1 VOC family protein [Rhizobium sp. S152]
MIDNDFDHVGFITRDLDRTLDFWTKQIGLEATPVVERTAPWVEQMTGIAGAKLRIAHLFGKDVHLEFLELLDRDPSEATPVNSAANCTGHVCIRVDDPVACLARVEAAGGRAIGSLATITEGALAGYTGVYAADPNGLLVEILQRKQ